MLPVSVEPVVLRDFPITVDGRGEVLPGDERRIYAPFSAPVAAVTVGAGAEVTAGQVIVCLSTRELERSLAGARERLLAAQSRLAERLRNNPNLINRSGGVIDALRAELAALEARFDAGEIGFDQYSRRQTEITVALINEGAYVRDISEIEVGITEAQRTVVELEEQLAAAEVPAPIDGVVEPAHVRVGEPVRAGAQIATVYSFAPAKARVSLVEEDALRVRPGDRAMVRLGVGGDTVVPGTVERVLPERGPDGGYHAELILRPDGTQLLNGMFAQAEIVVEVLPSRLVVPVDALLRENENYYVFVIEDGMAWWRWVDVGVRSGDSVTVAPDPFTPSGEAERIHGVDPGELVAVAGHTLLGHKGRVVIDHESIR